MIWSVILAAVAYFAIASAGYELARCSVVRDNETVTLLLHVTGILALAAAIYFAANSN